MPRISNQANCESFNADTILGNGAISGVPHWLYTFVKNITVPSVPC